MRSLIYVASYPRSGNTFLRALLANFYSKAENPLTPKEIAFFGAGEKHEAIWRAATGLDAHERTIEIEWAARETYMSQVRDTPGAGPIYLKTHTLNGVVFGRPGFFFAPGDKIVYVIRHPLDVLVSAAHFFEIDIEAMAERMLLSGAFNTAGGGYFDVTGSWIENVGGWVTETRCPILLVRYEALATATAAELHRVLDFVGEDASPADCDRAARAAAFEVLKAGHAEHGFDQGPGRDPRHTFFRTGEAGGWRKALPPALIARMTAELGDYMRTFEYDGG